MNDADASLKRGVDIICALILVGLASLPMIGIALFIKITSPGPILFWSSRVGRNNRLFRMPKFRTMRKGTPNIATHLMTNPRIYVTPIGRVLRKTSLDELPQLFSVLKGDMSFVGPRPALFNQDDLVALRTAAGVHRLSPGITGWAQINGRDELPIPVKVKFDAFYTRYRTLRLDLKILILTLLKVFRREGVNH